MNPDTVSTSNYEKGRTPLGALPHDSTVYSGLGRLAEQANLRRLRSFLTLGQLEHDPCPFVETPVTFRLDFALVDENVTTIIRLDEAKPFGVVEPLHCTFRHTTNLYFLASPAGTT